MSMGQRGRARGKRKHSDSSEVACDPAPSAIEWLLAPTIRPAAFFADHWERSHLFLQHSKVSPDRYNRLTFNAAGAITSGTSRRPLFDAARLLEIARQHGPLQLGRQLQVMRVGAHGREAAPPPVDGLASVSWLSARLDEGFTVQLFQPQHWCDRLWALLASMESEVGALCGCSVYHTPAGCQGLAPHHDVQPAGSEPSPPPLSSPLLTAHCG